MSGPRPSFVTILCQLFYPELVSTGQTLTELSEELTDLGVKVTVICGPPTIASYSCNETRINYKGIEIRRVWGTRLPKLNTFGKLVNLISYAVSCTLSVLFSRDRSPLLIVTNPPFLGLVGLLAKWLRGRRYIFLVFDVYPDAAVNGGMISRGGLIERVWNSFNRAVYRNAAHVIVLGKKMAELIADCSKLGHSHPDILHILPVWADDRMIHPKPQSESRFLKEWGLEGKFVVQYSGNMARNHDLKTICGAMEILKDHPTIHFVFIGEGYRKQEVVDFIKTRNIHNCSIYSYVDREDLPESLSIASVGLLSLEKGQAGISVPSKMFGIMAAGRPVLAVVPDDSEVTEIILTHRYGVVIRNGDSQGLAEAILRLHNDKPLYQDYCLTSRKTLDNHFSLHCTAEKYQQIIEALQAN